MRPPDPPDVLARFTEGRPYVRTVAIQLRRLGVHLTIEELCSYGDEGLLEAVRAFDPGLGHSLIGWVCVRIRGRMIDGIRRSGRLPSRLAKDLRALDLGNAYAEATRADGYGPAPPGMSRESLAEARLEELLRGMATAMALGYVVSGDKEPDPDASPEEQVAEAELSAAVRAAIARLPESPHQRVVQRFFFEEIGIVDIARELGLSATWVGRITKQVVETIAADLRARRVG